MSLFSTINQVLLLRDPTFIFLNLGLSNPIETVKKLQYSVRCAIAVEHNYSNIQIVLPLTWTLVLIAKNDAHVCVCVCVCVTRASDRDVKAYTSGTTVYSWHWNWQTLL